MRDTRLFRVTKLIASDEQRDQIYKASLASGQIDTEYAALLILSALVALFGLLENSAAVIIGAMLISPLMNPILSAALSLLLGDGHLGRRSASVLAISIAGVVGVTWFVAILTPLHQTTAEILARTNPNLLDLFIAFLSGLAGTLALRGGSVALTILPGVAIAVAVVPPLAVVGYGLSTRQWSIAGGAFLLFVTNLVSIIISAALVFRIYGFQPHRETEQSAWKLKYRVGISALILLLLAIPLFLTLRNAALEIAVRSEVRHELQAAFGTKGATVSDPAISRQRDGLVIRATLYSAQYLDADTVRLTEAALRGRFGPETRLQVDQILMTQGGVPAGEPKRQESPISGGVVRPEATKAPFDLKDASRLSLAFVQGELNEIIAGTRIGQKAPPEIQLAATPPIVLKLHLVAPDPLNRQTLDLLSSQMQSRLGQAVELHGVVELGAAWRMTFSAEESKRGLTADRRTSLGKLVAEADRQNLRLQLRFASGAEDQPVPRVVSQIRSYLARSRLKSSQWTVESAPQIDSTAGGGDTATNAQTVPKKPASVVPSPLGCELKASQDF